MSLLTKEKFLKSSSVYFGIETAARPTPKSGDDLAEGEKMNTDTAKAQDFDRLFAETDSRAADGEKVVLGEDGKGELGSADLPKTDMNTDMDAALDDADMQEVLGVTEEVNDSSNERKAEVRKLLEETNARMDDLEGKLAQKDEEIATLKQQLAQAKVPYAENITPKDVAKSKIDVAKDAIGGLKEAAKNGGFMKAMKGMFSGLGKFHNAMRNAPPAVKFLMLGGAAGLAVLAVAGWPIAGLGMTLLPGGIAGMAPGLAGSALAIKAAAAVGAGYLTSAVLSNGDPKQVNEASPSLTEQPINTAQTSPEQSSSVSNENSASPEAKMEQAKFITDVLKANPGAEITLKEGPAIQHLKLSFDSKTNNYFSADTSGNRKAFPQSSFVQGLSNLQQPILDDLKDQATALGNKKPEAPKSNIESEKGPTSVKISECKKDDTIDVKDKDGNISHLKVVDPRAGTVSIIDSGGNEVIQRVKSSTDDGNTHDDEIIVGADILIPGIGKFKEIESVSVTPAAEEGKPSDTKAETKSPAAESEFREGGQIKKLPSTINSGKLEFALNADVNAVKDAKEGFDVATNVLKDKYQGGSAEDFYRNALGLDSKTDSATIQKIVETSLLLTSQSRAGKLDSIGSHIKEAKSTKIEGGNTELMDRFVKASPESAEVVTAMKQFGELAKLQVGLQETKKTSPEGLYQRDPQGGITLETASNLSKKFQEGDPSAKLIVDAISSQNKAVGELLTASTPEQLQQILAGNGKPDDIAMLKDAINKMNGYLALEVVPVITPLPQNEEKKRIEGESKADLEAKMKGLKPDQQISFTRIGKEDQVLKAKVISPMTKYGGVEGVAVLVETDIGTEKQILSAEDIATLRVQEQAAAESAEKQNEIIPVGDVTNEKLAELVKNNTGKSPNINIKLKNGTIISNMNLYWNTARDSSQSFITENLDGTPFLNYIDPENLRTKTDLGIEKDNTLYSKMSDIESIEIVK